MLTRKPHKGDRLSCARGRKYTVLRCDGGICWMLEDGKEDATSFIWRFFDSAGPAPKPPASIGEEDGRPIYPNQYMSEID